MLRYGLFNTETKFFDQFLIFKKTDCLNSFMENLLLTYPLTVVYFVIIFAVPFYHLIILPFFSAWILSLLKRTLIGLVALLVESIITSCISYFMTSYIEILKCLIPMTCVYSIPTV